MSSFKVKLVVYFVLLALVPLTAAFLGFTEATRRSETRGVDARLQGGLRAALTAYQDEVDAATRTATVLAGDRAFQIAVQEGNAAALRRFERAAPHLHIRWGTQLRSASDATGAERAVAVFSRGRLVGEILIAVPLDETFLQPVAGRAGLEPSDRLIVARGGRVAAGPIDLLGGPVTLAPGHPRGIELNGVRYRGLAGPALPATGGASLVVLTPQSGIDSAYASAELRLLYLVLASLGAIALVAFVFSRAIVRTLGELVRAAKGIASGRLDERVAVRGRDEFATLARAFNDMAGQLEGRVAELESERARMRELIRRFGAALAATHDPDELRRAIVETAVEATAATGGVLLGPDGELARAGEQSTGGERLELPLDAGRHGFGLLVLTGEAFSPEDREAASSLVRQAVVALDNARLHEIVARQALVDELTELANRRGCEHALRSELSRARRYREPVAFVLCDLDGFKGLNDAHGHQFGDAVLRAFGRTIRETVREIDHAGRWGGEEFALLLPGTDLAGGVRLAERIRLLLASEPLLAPGGALVSVTASFGVSAHPACGSEAELVAAADEALYRAKREGRNRVAAAGETAAFPT